MVGRRDSYATHVQTEMKQQLPPPPPRDTDAQPIDFEAAAENIRLQLRSNGIHRSESASNDGHSRSLRPGDCGMWSKMSPW